MPATEQTWRDLKWMHVVFGVSSVLMLVTTIWMLTADHQREWKTYQRDFREVEVWTAKSRVSAQENDPQYNEELKKREAAFAAAQQEIPSKELFEQFKEKVVADAERRDETPPSFRKLDGLYDTLERAEEADRPAAKAAFLDGLREYVREAKFREDTALTKKKFKAADFDVARSDYELAIGNGLPPERIKELLDRIEVIRDGSPDGKEKGLAALTLAVQDATTHRKELESVLGEMTASQALAKKELDDQKQALVQLEKAVAERGGTPMTAFARDLLSMPIIDAFGRPLDIKQIWLPKLTINYNFREVPRFDRCITCHLAIDKSAPGSAVEPGYREQHLIPIELATPSEPPTFAADATLDDKVRQMYGIVLIDHDFLQDDDASIEIVEREKLAAKSGLQVGDVIAQVGKNRTPVVDREAALNYLLEVPTWGQPISIWVERGLPNPYTSHPRLDLFVGSLSPHKLLDVGCTICHDGQGSATQFKWASHTPNDPAQELEWKLAHGWFNNHHWIFPMPPARHAESTCLKCHHEVESLLPSERFPEPPAPKLVDGFQTFKDVGCYGCHEVNGYDGPNRRLGPDLRTEPNYSAAAKSLLVMKGLNDEERGWAEELVNNPVDPSIRRDLFDSVTAGSRVAPDSTEPPRIDQTTLKMAQVLQDVEVPGKYRKVGPSLRHVKSKVDDAWLFSWIRKPTDFRPDTKMPQFFGLHDHLELETKEETKYFEGIEIRGITAYLQDKSQPFKYLSQAEDTEDPSAERGKNSFQMRGCLACHKHNDFPEAKMTQGPNLSNIGGKLGRSDDGKIWLYTWLRNPSSYHPRTLMPNLILDPIKDADGKLIDPAADITAFLLTSGADWKPANIPPVELSKEEEQALKDLALENLQGVFTTKQAKKILKEGIPSERASETTGDAVELIGAPTVEKQLTYVGRRAIAKYGCSGCHDIPGFEDAKPIGTGLADWGRKGADKLAFEQITTYLSRAHGAHEAEMPESEAEAHEAKEHKFIDMPSDEGFFMQKLFGHEREGFIWQKLRAPRSFDYKKVENKGYNERLRMPKFTVLTEEQRQEIITFVLGLVAEPPAVQYVYAAPARQEAIIEGKKVLEKYNCGGCHTLQMDAWKLAYPADAFDDPAEQNDYDFLIAHATDAEIAMSQVTDMRGLRHATIHGQPEMDGETGKPIRLDEDGAPIDPSDTATPGVYNFVLWKNAVINGKIWPAGIQNLLVPEKVVEKRFAIDGGYLPRLIMPVVYQAEKVINPNAKVEETWAYLPPPLVNEGHKAQSNWLHSFLLDPYMIRPATVLRMPKFNMSSDEATKLVNYFAAVEKADYPYNYDPRTSEQHLVAAEASHPHRMTDALKIVTDNSYCVKCHLVGDFVPKNSDRAKGPQLGKVYERLRPEFLRDWIANPKRILPYTAMPVNIPHNMPVKQELFKGDSVEQLDAVVDLLLNWDRFMESKTSIKPLVKEPPPTDAAATEK